MHHRTNKTLGLTEQFLAHTLHDFGNALIGIFIPIYLITIGYSLQQALLYLLVHYLIVGLVSPTVGHFTQRYGLKHTTLVRIPFFLTTFILLYLLPTTNIHFLIPAALSGAATALYWLPMNMLFLRESTHEKRGSQAGRLQATRAVARIAAPAIGGVVATVLGFNILILIALAITTVSTIPLFMTKDRKGNDPFRWKDMWDLRHHEIVGLALGDGAAHLGTNIFFPLLIFLTLSSTESVGFVASIGTLAFAISAMIGGKILDRDDKIRWLRISIVLFAITIAVRPLFDTFWEFAMIIILGGAIGGLYVTSNDAILFEYARNLKDKGDEFIVVREMFLNLGRVALIGLAIMLPLWLGFVICAMIMIGTSISMRGHHLQ